MYHQYTTVNTIPPASFTGVGYQPNYQSTMSPLANPQRTTVVPPAALAGVGTVSAVPIATTVGTITPATSTAQYGRAGVGPIVTASNANHAYRNACVNIVELARYVDPEGIQSRLNTLVDSIQRGKLNSKDLYQIRELVGAAAEAVGYQYLHGTPESGQEFDAMIDDFIAIQQGKPLQTPGRREIQVSKYAGTKTPVQQAALEFQKYCKTNKIEIRDFKEFRTFWEKMLKRRKDLRDKFEAKEVFTAFQAL